jgi:hypothetical protein
MKIDTLTSAKEPSAGSVSALLSVEAVSEYTGIPVATLNTWRPRGEGPPWYKLGGKIVRYRAQDVEWIDSQQEEPSELTRTRREVALPIPCSACSSRSRSRCLTRRSSAGFRSATRCFGCSHNSLTPLDGPPMMRARVLYP